MNLTPAEQVSRKKLLDEIIIEYIVKRYNVIRYQERILLDETRATERLEAKAFVDQARLEIDAAKQLL